MFFNTLTTDDKYSLLHQDNLMQSFQMLLPQKQKMFSQSFFELNQIFNIFKKRTTLIADLFPKLRNAKNMVRLTSKKSRFRGALDRQHGKRAETLLQSERQHLYQSY